MQPLIQVKKTDDDSEAPMGLLPITTHSFLPKDSLFKKKKIYLFTLEANYFTIL